MKLTQLYTYLPRVPRRESFILLHDTVFERVVEIEVTRHFGRETGFLLIGNEVGQVFEIVADKGLSVEAHRVGGILFAAVETTFIAVFVDGIQVKVDGGDYARLVVEHFLYIQILFNWSLSAPGYIPISYC